ncbi:E3 ubiquitin-protein ligase complex slx8-rfp subunit rfp1 [Phlyctema vagabunda]|uniref:E3 ubiquitin-protein ligase complex slx8-rfp subunit rfp1 n=1 Tax=Phlyctema vagabunda TaxID=108571 RepID=A0ABR4PJ40_9HELO
MDDGWRNQRHPKRSYTTMSQQATLSPSPVVFRDHSPAVFEHLHFMPHEGPHSRRRTSHPHNRPLDQSSRAEEDMPNGSQSQHRPRLEHRTSQTIIDLTDDVEEEQDPRLRLGGEGNRRQRPPQLARNDAIIIRNVIDLTDEVPSPPSPEILITHSRQLPAAAAPASAPASNRSRTLPQPNLPQDNARIGGRAFLFPEDAMMQAFGDIAQRLGPNGFGAFLFGAPPDPGHHVHFARDHDINFQEMPGPMNYQHPAHARNLARQRKPDHKPPPAARDGFTRSPTEEDTVICPACEEELIHRKVEDEPAVAVKKTTRAPSRKDREEHPFWVVKECGHVYCNNCFQSRGASSKSPTGSKFPSTSKTPTSKKTLLCAVDDCESEVKNKDRWVGVFL